MGVDDSGTAKRSDLKRLAQHAQRSTAWVEIVPAVMRTARLDPNENRRRRFEQDDSCSVIDDRGRRLAVEKRAFADATAAVARLRKRRIGVAFRRRRTLLSAAAATAAFRIAPSFRDRFRRASDAQRSAAAERTGDERRDQQENCEPAEHALTVALSAVRINRDLGTGLIPKRKKPERRKRRSGRLRRYR